MYLSDEQWDDVVRRLNQIPSRTCPVCGADNMAVGRFVFEMRPFAFGELASAGPILPVIPAECGSCGHILMFNAVSLGIVPLDEEGQVPDDQ